jgi:hypothetical protein
MRWRTIGWIALAIVGVAAAAFATRERIRA